LSKPKTFQQFHKYFKQLAVEEQIKYLFRHFDGNVSANSFIFSYFNFLHQNSTSLPFLSLSGYGVELAIKSTEYKAIDDSSAKNNNEENEAPTNLHGFNFQTLRFSQKQN
jgi:UDP-glucose:glycoprotein glucosyltransferase